MHGCASGVNREIKMAKDKEKPVDAAGEAAPKKGKGKLLVIIIAAVVLLAGGGGAAWFFLHAKKPASAEEAKHEAPDAPPVFAKLEQFTVNLTADGEEHYLQTDVELKVADAKVVDAIKSHMPEIRSNLLLLLSSKTASVMATMDGKKKLSKEIAKQVNEILHAKESEGVSDVYFTTFVIQ